MARWPTWRTTPDSRMSAPPLLWRLAPTTSPLEMAGAYTIFANGGTKAEPRMISHIKDKFGNDVWSSEPQTKNVLDPRVNFLMVDLMQEVLRSGTGARVHAYGFNLPAAGKTGTSHDAWFAGFTTKLLCIVWVGLDDYQDIKLEGARAALPIWAEFMRRAHKHRAYRDVTQFKVPEGVVSAIVDQQSGGLATSACPQDQIRTEYYLLGTQPVQFCPLHQGGSTEIAGWETAPVSPPPSGVLQPPPTPPAYNTPDIDAQNEQQPKKQKRGFFDRLKSIFK